MREQLRSLALVVRTAFRADPWRSVGSFLAEGAGGIAYPLNGLWLKLITDGAVRGDLRLALGGALAMAALQGGGMLLQGLGTRMRLTLMERTGFEFQKLITQVTAELPGLEHHERPDYLDRLQLLRDAQRFLGGSANAIAVGLMNLFRFGGILVLLGTLHPLLLLIPLFALPLAFVQRRHQGVMRAVEDATAPDARLARHLFDLGLDAGAAKETRVFGLEGELTRRHREAMVRTVRPRISAQWKTSILSVGAWAIFGVAFLGGIAFVAWRASIGAATPGDVLMAITVSEQVSGQVMGIVFALNWIQEALRSAGRLVWLLDYTKEARTSGGRTPPGRFEQGISFDRVSFRYPGTDERVLRDVSIHLPTDSVVALVGENGAGKTTLVKLLCRFYEPTEGRILIDGSELSGLDIGSWREHISTGFQDFARLELLAGESVGVGALPWIDDEASVRAALERAGGTDVADGLPEGLRTQLGKQWEAGVELSEGQWQKLALGRALMRTGPLVLIFDEPTASLDAPTEHALFERFTGTSHQGEGSVTLLVSHRFSTVRMADLIVVLDAGRVVEQGSHPELMARGGLYAELYEIQARAYR